MSRRAVDVAGAAAAATLLVVLAWPALRDVSLPGSHYVEIPGVGAAGSPPRQPELPGWVVIGATNLQGTYRDQRLRDACAFLRRCEPAASGGAMYVDWVERWGE